VSETLGELRAKRVFFTRDIIPDVPGIGWPTEVTSLPKGAYVFYAYADIDVPILIVSPINCDLKSMMVLQN
jgi:hypothetical protein